jgi:glutamate formiminotransferase/formiminotetrahydrofolate cyclodeaminase
MGLNDIHQFNPEEKIIEFVMADKDKKMLVDMNLKAFMDETSSESPAPGGGSVSAYIGSLGAALGTMVANLSSHKRGWDDRWEEFSAWAEKGKEIQNRLLSLVDEDTRAFNKIMDAMSMPKKSEEEKTLREKVLDDATVGAIMIPWSVMETAFKGFEIVKAMAETGNPNSVSDAGVGALALMTCVRGACLNVKINASSLRDKTYAKEFIEKAGKLEKLAISTAEEIIKIVESKISG